LVEDLLTDKQTTKQLTSNQQHSATLSSSQQSAAVSSQQSAAVSSKTMSAAVLHLTEATLGFPNIYDKGMTEVTLCGEGTGAWMTDPDAYHKILTLVIESGMHWEEGRYRAAVLANISEMEEWEEHGTAYDQWCQGEVNMDDLHEPSLFTEWNQAAGCSTYVGAGEMKKNMKIPEFTPEMLQQRDTLNWCFNFLWNNPHFTSITADYDPEINLQVTDTIELLTLTAVGDNHGVAKCQFGAVFIPRGALKHLQHNGGAAVGTIFDGEITFTPGNKFPWRLTRDGVKFTYEDMCGTRQPDDY